MVTKRQPGYRVRYWAVWLAGNCWVAPEIFEQVILRWQTFREPVVDTWQGQALWPHAKTSVSGRLSDVERQNVASIASQGGPNRLGLQGCIGWTDGDAAPWRKTWLDQVGQAWGQGDGVLVCAPSACPTAGRESVGVARQWGGRWGKVDNGPVAISVGYVLRQGHPRVDLRLYLPKEWTQEKARLQTAGVPTARSGDRTRHPVAVERREPNAASLPRGWMAGDDERGRPYWFRRRLAAWGDRDRLAVPSHTMRPDLETPAQAAWAARQDGGRVARP
jgi:SRSO17 transposase